MGSGASSWSIHGPHPTPTPPLPENRELWGGLPASVLLPPSWWNLSFTRPGVQLPPHFSDPLGPLGRPSTEMAAYFLPFTLHCSISSPEGKACLGYSHLPVLKQDLAHSRCLVNTGRLPSEPAGPPSPAPVLTRATWTVNSTPMPTDATRITPTSIKPDQNNRTLIHKYTPPHHLDSQRQSCMPGRSDSHKLAQVPSRCWGAARGWGPFTLP